MSYITNYKSHSLQLGLFTPLINNMKRLFLVFINNLFLKWTGTFEELIKFKENINTVHSTIKFEFNFSLKSIIFLDTIVYQTLTGKLGTTSCTKKTDPQKYSHHRSEHLKSLEYSIRFAQALRICLICTS